MTTSNFANLNCSVVLILLNLEEFYNFTLFLRIFEINSTAAMYIGMTFSIHFAFFFSAFDQNVFSSFGGRFIKTMLLSFYYNKDLKKSLLPSHLNDRNSIQRNGLLWQTLKSLLYSGFEVGHLYYVDCNWRNKNSTAILSHDTFICYKKARFIQWFNTVLISVHVPLSLFCLIWIKNETGCTAL